MIKKIFILVLSLVVGGALALLTSLPVGASFHRDRLMDDSIYNNSGTMSASQINAFLNSFPGSCISPDKGFKAPDPTGYSPSTSYTYGSDVTAGTIIYHAAQAYDLNPRVILATLQKEQSLVTGGDGTICDHPTTSDKLPYVGAMGNGCPDGGHGYNYSGFELYSINDTKVTSVSGTCVNSSRAAGFARQVITATWKLKFWQQRSLGNVSWAEIHDSWDNSDDPAICYNYYMTPGDRARGGPGSGCTQVLTFDGDYTIDGTGVHMSTGATAALYVYTPHLSGNQHFVSIYEGWWGSTTGPCAATGNISSKPSGRQILADQYAKSGSSNLAFTRLNNTGSACAEVHVWVPGYSGWEASLQTALPAVDPSKSMFLFGNLTGSQRDELTYAKFASGSGQVEMHILDSTYQSWLSRTATNLSNIALSDGTFVAGDMNGDGQDEILYIKYSGTSGQVEVYRWAASLKSWASHGVTNLSAVSSTNGQFVAGDMNDDGKDELMYVKYSGASGQVEVYTWAPGYHSWISHKITNVSATTASAATFVAGDMNDDGKDELMYVKYSGASGQVEVYTWLPNYRTWASHKVTSLAAFDPAT